MLFSGLLLQSEESLATPMEKVAAARELAAKAQTTNQLADAYREYRAAVQSAGDSFSQELSLGSFYPEFFSKVESLAMSKPETYAQWFQNLPSSLKTPGVLEVRNYEQILADAKSLRTAEILLTPKEGRSAAKATFKNLDLVDLAQLVDRTIYGSLFERYLFIRNVLSEGTSSHVLETLFRRLKPSWGTGMEGLIYFEQIFLSTNRDAGRLVRFYHTASFQFPGWVFSELTRSNHLGVTFLNLNPKTEDFHAFLTLLKNAQNLTEGEEVSAALQERLFSITKKAIDAAPSREELSYLIEHPALSSLFTTDEIKARTTAQQFFRADPPSAGSGALKRTRYLTEEQASELRRLGYTRWSFVKPAVQNPGLPLPDWCRSRLKSVE